MSTALSLSRCADYDRDRACEQHSGRYHERGMRARHERVVSSDQRAEQGNAKHAAGLPRCVQDTGGDAGSRLVDTAEQRRGQRRHEQAEPAPEDHELSAELPVARA